MLSHVFKTASAPSSIDMSDALACPVPDPNYDPTATKAQSYEYIHADDKIDEKSVEFAVLPNWGDEVYDHGIANLCHSRSLAFLKPRIGGPWFDLEKVGLHDSTATEAWDVEADLLLTCLARSGMPTLGMSSLVVP